MAIDSESIKEMIRDGGKMKRSLVLIILVCVGLFIVSVNTDYNPVPAAESYASHKENGYTGTASCRECHEKFYKLWSSSHHAKAMQPFSEDLASLKLTPQLQEITIGRYRYRVDVASGIMWENGPDGEKNYPIAHVLGGKNVWYFLTLMERGRLQTLPVAYDVHTKKWFDTAKSGVRHFPGSEPDEAINWKDWPYTFNTACYNCHVSQLDTNYDLKTDTYNTRWAEPGINCETCHGPCDEHIRVCREAPEGTIPNDLKIIRGGRDFTAEQNNDACSACHARLTPIAEEFTPGDSFFDFFDLVALEHADYYPDGRDLGENYTLTSWLLSPCVNSGELSCLHCHTSSGRFRQKDDPNKSCMPCHQKRVENSTAHTFHKKESNGNLCISCHMPMTTYARMRRSDHSMLPPVPSATIAFESPNACNLCHDDKDAAWADKWVRTWRKRDYQSPLVQRAELIDAARKEDWARLSEMLDYIKGKDRDAVFAVSLIRLLRACPDPAIFPVILDAAKDPSPLIRSSAIESLGRYPIKNTSDVLLAAVGDNSRLVRIKAAAVIAGHPKTTLTDAERDSLNKATAEYLAAMKIRPDHWVSHYNLGNFYRDNGDLPSALAAYDQAIRLEPRAVMPMINAAMVYAQNGKNNKIEELLKMALDISPDNASANFNMGLLKAEQKKKTEAETYLRRAVKSDPKMHKAVFILGMLLAGERPNESIERLSKAFEMNKSQRYTYTLAFYLHQNKEFDRAAQTFRFMIENWPQYADSYLLLADIHEKQNRKSEAIQLLGDALERKEINVRDKFRLTRKLKDLQNNQ